MIVINQFLKQPELQNLSHCAVAAWLRWIVPSSEGVIAGLRVVVFHFSFQH